MKKRSIVATLALMVTGAALFGAEPTGGEAQAEVSAEERKAELDLRRKAIAADLQVLRERQKRQAPAAARQALNEKLQAIADKKGYGDPDRLYQVSYIEGFIKDRSLAPAPSVVEALKAFSDQLAERGIDLIFVPVGDNVLVHAWKLQDGISPDADIWPGQTRALVALLENNIEVIDAAGLWRKHVAAGGADPVNPYDHHWSGVGIQLIAKEIGERMQRYDFVRAAAADRKRYSVQKIDVQTPSQLISINGIAPHQEWMSSKPDKWGLPPKSAAWQVLYDGQVRDPKAMANRIDPVLVVGDSNVPHLSGWGDAVGSAAGFPEHLSMALGLAVARRAEADGARLMPRRYAENLAQLSPQPRVIVMAITMENLFNRWDVFTLPPRKPVVASATFVGLDSKTRGNWKGVYGADGYKIIGDAEKYPPYASYEGGGQVFRTYTPEWHMLGYADPDAGLNCVEMIHTNKELLVNMGERALLKASSNDGERIAAAWAHHGGKNFAVDIKLQDAQEHQVALYLPTFLWPYATTLEVQDYTTRKVLVPGVDIKHEPTYAIFKVRGHVRFLFRCKTTSAAVAGIFFDPVKAETFTVDARVVFATPAPNPKTSAYKDALTTTVFAAEAAPEQKKAPAKFSAIQWVMKDAKLLPPASGLAAGQRWRLTLTAWDAAVGKDKHLETLRRVDETEFDADRPVYWVEKAEPIQ